MKGTLWLGKLADITVLTGTSPRAGRRNQAGEGRLHDHRRQGGLGRTFAEWPMLRRSSAGVATAGPNFATAMPAAWFARRAASTSVAPAARASASSGDDGVAAPVTSDTSRADAGSEPRPSPSSHIRALRGSSARLWHAARSRSARAAARASSSLRTRMFAAISAS